jgi:hypothetical protein
MLNSNTLEGFFGNSLFGPLAGEGPAGKQQPCSKSKADAALPGDSGVVEVMPS